jgi:hypothetical protein
MHERCRQETGVSQIHQLLPGELDGFLLLSHGSAGVRLSET